MHGKVKDCSNCDKPHQAGGYEHVIDLLTRYFAEISNGSAEQDRGYGVFFAISNMEVL